MANITLIFEVSELVTLAVLVCVYWLFGFYAGIHPVKVERNIQETIRRIPKVVGEKTKASQAKPEVSEAKPGDVKTVQDGVLGNKTVKKRKAPSKKSGTNAKKSNLSYFADVESCW